jgi:hypothetical protein
MFNLIKPKFLRINAQQNRLIHAQAALIGAQARAWSGIATDFQREELLRLAADVDAEANALIRLCEDKA